MLQKKPKILCNLSVLAVHSSIPGREPRCRSNSPVVLCREQGCMRTTEFMPQTITNDHYLRLMTCCLPKWTTLARQLPGRESDHWTCSRRLRRLPLPAAPDSWRDPPSHQVEANPQVPISVEEFIS